VPRFLGVTVSMVLLTVYFNFFGLFGSFLLSQLVQRIPLAEYVTNLLATLTPADLVSSLVLPAGPCLSCSACSVQCLNRWNVRERIQDIVRLREVPSEFIA
jgi:ABC-type transporter Mla maintaining outer membrane lipid asymmetry permease subunit MlaE